MTASFRTEFGAPSEFSMSCIYKLLHYLLHRGRQEKEFLSISGIGQSIRA